LLSENADSAELKYFKERCFLNTSNDKLLKSFPPVPYKVQMLCLMTGYEIWNKIFIRGVGGGQRYS